MFDEIHDLPATPTAKDCWVGIRRIGDVIVCTIFATSRATGCDLPAQCDVVRPHHGR